MIFNKLNKAIISIPEELLRDDYYGNLYGYYHRSSNYFNVVATERNDDIQHLENIGRISASQETTPIAHKIYGLKLNGKTVFSTPEAKYCQIEPYSLVMDIFSRNTGILETKIMCDKCAIISGCGSVGSLVALELARAGVGQFLLVDNDILSYHNICRHQCGVADVGKYKVDAVKERILQINPTAKIGTVTDVIERVPKSLFDTFATSNAVIIGCADNREGDLYANKIAKLYQIPFVSIGFWERAFAGEIFYTLAQNHPCYDCFCQSIGKSMSQRTSTNRRIYTNEAELEKVNFEPGISTDINFVTNIAIKLILDILNRHSPQYIPKLLHHLTQFTLVCNTDNPKIGGELAEIFSYPLQVTTSIELNFCNECAVNQICKLSTNV